jgi:hypothetical protein
MLGIGEPMLGIAVGLGSATVGAAATDPSAAAACWPLFHVDANFVTCSSKV